MIGADLNPFKLSKRTCRSLKMYKIKYNVFITKNDVISISVRDQDPYISALLVDSVTAHLQTFIVEYRTKKLKLTMSIIKNNS